MFITIRSHLPRLAACSTLLAAFTTITAPQSRAEISPQDGMHLLSSFELPESSVEQNKSALQTVNGQDLVYYKFYDSGLSNYGIRARDLDGNLVYELLGIVGSPDEFVVSPSGRLFVKQDRRIHIYTLNAGTYSELTSIGPDGPGGNDYGFRFQSYGTMTVSSVSGKFFVDDQAEEQDNLQVSGNIRVYDANGNYLESFNTNGILAATLEGGIDTLDAVPGHDGSGEIWVRPAPSWAYQGYYDGSSRWFKVFAEDGTFKRLFDAESTYTVTIQGDLMFKGQGDIIPLTAETASDIIGYTAHSLSYFLGRDSVGRHIELGYSGNSKAIKIREAQVFRTFSPRDRNAVPNPVVSKIEQRSGSTVLDIDFRVEDSDDATVTVAAIALADGTQNVLNAIPMTSFVDGTASNLGAGISTNTRHHLAWNAGSDWNVDFGDISVMVLARDSRTHQFDVHLVEIPVDGARPAVTISRNPLKEYDFTMQWLWLIARADPSITVTNGIVFGVGGDYDGEQLTDSSGNSTALGRAFLLGLDGLRVATPAEVTRAREGATPGYVVRTDPPRILYKEFGNMPYRINEYGIESYNYTFQIGAPRLGGGSSYVDYTDDSTERIHVVLTNP